MSDERDDLFEEESYEAIFRSLREKYNLDNKRPESKQKDFYNPDEDTELQDFFDEKAKKNEEKANEYIYDEFDVSEKDEKDAQGNSFLQETPQSAKTGEQKVNEAEESGTVISRNFSADNFEQEKNNLESSGLQKPEDYEWDENTRLNFDVNTNKHGERIPLSFEDVSSNTVGMEEEEKDDSLVDSARENQSMTADETPDDNNAQESAIEDGSENGSSDEDGNTGAIFQEVKEEIAEENGQDTFEESSFSIGNVDEESENDDIESTPEGFYSDDTSMKHVTYESINWDDFPTKKDMKRERKRLKKEKKKQKRRKIIPQKGDSVSEIIRKVILMISILAIIGSSGGLVNDLVIQPYLAKRLYDSINNSLVDKSTNKVVGEFDDLSNDDKALTTKELLAKNKEYIGWLTVKGAQVSLPVVKTNDNYSYLHKGFDGNYLNAGTLFVDMRNKSLDDRNIVIYGHNMDNGTMFGLLRKYKQGDGAIYRQYPEIMFHTIDGKKKYEIYAAYLVDGAGTTDSDFISKTVATDMSDETFMDYMETIKQKAYYQTNVTVKSSDKIITLITCDRNKLKTGRLAVVGRLVEK